jgi:hypothetical protein
MLARSQRKNFVFPPEALEILAWLKAVCFIKRDADVLRLALGTLSDVMLALEKGDKVVFRSANGRERPYHPFLDIADKARTPPTEALKRYKKGELSNRAVQTA